VSLYGASGSYSGSTADPSSQWIVPAGWYTTGGSTSGSDGGGGGGGASSGASSSDDSYALSGCDPSGPTLVAGGDGYAVYPIYQNVSLVGIDLGDQWVPGDVLEVAVCGAPYNVSAGVVEGGGNGSSSRQRQRRGVAGADGGVGGRRLPGRPAQL
jgi:hypothetical protein